MEHDSLQLILEALLMSSEKPLTINTLHALFVDEGVSEQHLYQALHALKEMYQDRAIALVETASGFRFHTKKAYAEWISRLNAEKPAKYSRALLETLAIIAYKQPVTRGDIEAIRGVAVNSSIIKTLQEREWIRVAGHRDVPGKPSVYVTTESFLDYFNLKTMNELPLLQIEETQ